MVILRLVNVKDKYWFPEGYHTIGKAWERLKRLKHSNKIKCIGVCFDDDTPSLPPHLYDAYISQLPNADSIIEYQYYPLYINTKGEQNG